MNVYRNTFPIIRYKQCSGSSPHPLRRTRRQPLQRGPLETISSPPALETPNSSCGSLGVLLLVEADPETRGLLRFCFEKEGYEVIEAESAVAALEQSERADVTALVLSVDPCDGESIITIKRLRDRTRAHLMVLSLRGGESDKLSAFDAGANDYLVRPFSMRELAARLRAAHRQLQEPPPTAFQIGNLMLDLSSRVVEVGGRSVKLTATEFSLLSLFVRHAGKALTHAQILKEIWGPRMLTKVEYLRVYLKALREKIETDPEKPELLVTERSIGYRLAVPGR